ncbi:hypothetical protein N1030_01570 [Desulfovibrio mangrovi]|uniref:hypothetical protein n=1 Tax=Desulfovibrio mangrovi TaxID=2976983 RepID=UPI0022471D09|nr:hypothetical protein [Desulfovibrio mangrovi]UZP67683.1 hypothetical protein N1030_01570 [Desulfovibrio mangrovi]
MADFMKTETEAKALICPQMSTFEHEVHCLGSGCAMWCRERAVECMRHSHTVAGENSLNDEIRKLEAASGELNEEQAEAFAIEYASRFTMEPERPSYVPENCIWEYCFDPEEPWEFWCGWRESKEDALQRDRDAVKGWCGLMPVGGGM